MSNNFCKLHTVLLGHTKIHNRYNETYTNQLTCDLYVTKYKQTNCTTLSYNRTLTPKKNTYFSLFLP